MRPLCIRIARLLRQLWSDKSRPRLDTVSLVEWDPREYNTLANDAANMALDGNADRMVARSVPIMLSRSESVNYCVCFKGAMRGSGLSAGGVAIVSYYSDRRRDLLLRGCKLFGQLVASSLAETLALERAPWCFST